MLNNINKYIFDFIFEHLTYKRRLNAIRHNKKIQTKLEISLYTYQKKYFEIIITPVLLKNTEILIKNNIFDKNILDKLIIDWKKDSTELIQEKELFHFNQKTNEQNLKENKILNISLKELNLLNNIPNLIELNISNIINLELPCLILLNLESLSLKDISKLKFLNEEENLSLKKLKHLYLNNVSFHEENKIKINLNNLKYLDLRLKEEYIKDEDDEDRPFNKEDNTIGFYKEKTLENLINIFDFKFLSIFKIGQKQLYDEYHKYLELKIALKKPNELFNEKYLYKYDFFNLEILYRYSFSSASAALGDRFIYKYLFAKTKGDKYLFKTEFKFHDDLYESKIKEKRYCNKIIYDNYYFIDNKVEVGGDGKYEVDPNIDFEKVNEFNIISEYKYSYEEMFKNFKNNKNKIESITIEDINLDTIKLDLFLNNLKKFQGLKCFYITKECSFENINHFIDLLNSLSTIKSLYLIEIVIKGILKLNIKEGKRINEIFPDISIKKGKKKSHIKWKNNNYVLLNKLV